MVHFETFLDGTSELPKYKKAAFTFEKITQSQLSGMEDLRQFLTTGRKTGLKDKMFK